MFIHEQNRTTTDKIDVKRVLFQSYDKRTFLVCWERNRPPLTQVTEVVHMLSFVECFARSFPGSFDTIIQATSSFQMKRKVDYLTETQDIYGDTCGRS